LSHFVSKLPAVGTTIFTTMSNMASEYNAINLSQGYPDFDPPKALLELVAKHLNSGHNQYPPTIGVASLREQIVNKVLNVYGARVDVDAEITITSGATEALFVAIQAVFHPGDEVIVFDPAYDSYEPAVTMAQGKTVHLALDENFAIDWNQVQSAITDKTAAIIINSPHNPAGTVLNQGDLDNLASLVRDSNIYVLSDEVYEHMVFDGQQHLSLLAHDELRTRAFVVSSFGKTYHATGWKVAYCIAPPTLTNEFRKVHQFVTYTTHTPTQWAIAEFMASCPEHYLNLPDFYQHKRDLFNDLLADSGFRLKPSAGTYFQLADYSGLSNMKDMEFATYLTSTWVLDQPMLWRT